jgi:Lipocalin-like domain
MDRRTFTAMAASTVLTAEGAKAETASVRSRLIGCWTLLEADTVTDGKVTPWFGRKLPLTGILIYHPNGWVSAQICGARPTVKTSANFSQLPDAQKLESLSAYYGYYGTYKVDEAARTVTHTLVDSLWPYEKGNSLRRSFVLEKDVLRLTTAPLPTDDGRTTYFNRLAWKKIA